MHPRITALREEVQAKNADVCKLYDEIGENQPTREQLEKVKDLNKGIEEKEVELATLLESEGLKSQAQKRRDEFKQPANGITHPAPESSGDRIALAEKRMSVGQHVLEDPQFKAWRDAIVRGEQISRAQFGQSPSVGLKTLITGASSTLAGAFVVNDRLNIVDEGTFRRPLTIRDIVTNGNTNSDTVEYVREGTHTNAAAPVAEATATSGSSGTKPESAMVFSVVTETVKTIAHWIPATRRALADAAQIRTLIDSFLRYGLEEELEDQILTGDGTGENFTGILNTSGTQSQAWDTNVLTTTRKARTKVRTVGRTTPNAYVMHPNDWQTIDLLQDNEARYFFGGPAVLGTPRLWGLPVVETEGMTEGTSVVANWRMAVLWDREQANILVSDSHSDFFIRNLIVILAELRAAFGVIRPSAFVEIDMTA